MKLKLNQLATHINKALAPLYVLSGDEPLQLQEAVEHIKLSAKQQGFNERHAFSMTGNSNWDPITACMQNTSLFSDKKIIEIRLPSAKPGKTGGQWLQQLAKTPRDDILTIIIMGKCDAGTQKSAWLRALEQAGVFIQIWPVSPAELPAWLKQRMQQQGLHVEPAALPLLAEKVEGNLLAANQEIEKLILNYGTDKKLSLAEVSAAITNSSRYDIFSFADAVLAGNTKRSQQLLAGLKTENVEPILILWVLTKDIRLLLQSHLGKTKPTVWPSRRQLVQTALTRLNAKHLKNLLQQCATLDQSIKGVAPGEPWQQLQKLVMQLCTTE